MVATVDPPCDEDHEAETDDRDRRELPDRGERDATDEPGSKRGAPQHTIAATAAAGARSRSRIDDGFELFDGGGPSRASGGLVHAACQPERFFT